MYNQLAGVGDHLLDANLSKVLPEGCRLSRLDRGDLEASFDITLTTNRSILEKILTGDMRPMKAYATKRLRIKAKVKDLLMIKKLL